jgi:ketosteroid isomerase-like protein
MITRAGLLVIVFLFLLNFGLQAQHQDSIAVMKAVDKFVTAFNNFDWTTFKGSFTDDASIFYPFWNQSRRIQGRRDIETAWMTIFPEFGAPNNTRKLQISPKDVNLQIYGKTALVTFHLGDGATSLSRRTLVMVKKKQIWKITHLHASSVSSDKN